MQVRSIFKINFIIIALLLVFLVSCSKSKFYNSTNKNYNKSEIVSEEQLKNIRAAKKNVKSNNKKGLFSSIFGSNNEKQEKNKSTKSAIIDKNKKEDSKAKVEPKKEKKSYFSSLFKGNNENKIQESLPYRPNKIEKQNNLYVLSLTVTPMVDTKSSAVQVNNNKAEKVVENKLVSKDTSYNNFNIDNYDTNSKNDNTKQSTTANNNDLSKVEKQYKEYIRNLKYKTEVSSYRETSKNQELSEQDKALLDSLIATKKDSYAILYIYYGDINSFNSRATMNEKIQLTTYLNILRRYLYSKKINTLFIQETEKKSFSVKELFLVMKPIPKEEFDKLPKVSNVYNTPKQNSKEWFKKLNQLDKERLEKQKSLLKEVSN